MSERRPLYERIRDDLEADRGPLGALRALPTPLRLAVWLGGAVAVTVGLGVVSGGRPAGLVWALSALALFATAGVAAACALRPLHRPALSPRRQLGLAGAVLVSALAAILFVMSGAVGGLAGLRCLGAGVLAAAPVTALGAALDRAPPRGLRLGALAGGLAGSLAVHGSCGAHGLLHLVVEHFGVAVVAALFYGGLLGLAARYRSSVHSESRGRPA